jgi:hypothetical protein
MILFVILQDAQALSAETLPDIVRDGVFTSQPSAIVCDQPSRILHQLNEIFRRIPSMKDFHTDDPLSWNVGRSSVARGKMLWNYLRSGLGVSPELTTRILRAPTWSGFLAALDEVLLRLPEEDVGLTHRPEWDWVYAGAGHGRTAETVEDGRTNESKTMGEMC